MHVCACDTRYNILVHSSDTRYNRSHMAEIKNILPPKFCLRGKTIQCLVFLSLLVESEREHYM